MPVGPVLDLLSTGKPILMGILNLTPDSFSDGDPDANPEFFLRRARQMMRDGCDILDLGGESTRPGADQVSVEQELDRVLPFLELFRRHFGDFPVSLDTKKYEVAREASRYGIQVINDVSFLSDERLLDVAKEHNQYYVLMHSRGTPQIMTGLADYPDGLLSTIFSEIDARLQRIREAGFLPDHVILDPGFGFAKTPEQCREMMDNLDEWRRFKEPLLIGISRKRFLQLYTGENAPVERDVISAELSLKAIHAGFRIVRTHDVPRTHTLIESRRQIG